ANNVKVVNVSVFVYVYRRRNVGRWHAGPGCPAVCGCIDFKVSAVRVSLGKSFVFIPKMHQVGKTACAGECCRSLLYPCRTAVGGFPNSLTCSCCGSWISRDPCGRSRYVRNRRQSGMGSSESQEGRSCGPGITAISAS